MAAELRVVLGKLRRRLREHANKGDLSLSQLAVLGTLDREGPATVTTLARAEGVRPQSMGATIAALEEAGLVSGMPDPGDGRQVMLSLTDKARSWIKASRDAREDWLSQAIRSHLSATEQEELACAVGLLRRIVD
ncbi:MAG TPA: MarR family transcriptional regulator [Steroidobacteraceae bacterium]|jgi:DNA-binding MarR family transcriptional regulator|nr:MarR family transcriptional regulator [Steroidobacteraceae bacterium]